MRFKIGGSIIVLLTVMVIVGGWGCAGSQRGESSNIDDFTTVNGEERSERIEDTEGLMRRYRGEWKQVELSDDEVFESGGVPYLSVLLSVDMYEELMMSEGGGIIFVGAAGCGSSRWLAPIFEEVMQSYGIDRVYSIAAEHRSYEVLEEMPVDINSYPTLVVIDGGKVVDVQNGGERSVEWTRLGIRNLLVRNGLIDGEIELLSDYGERTDEEVRRTLRSSSHHHHADFDLRDLRDVEVVQASFAGSTFRNSDLRGANFEGAFLTHVDLRGARTEGANFSNVFWSNTICPDGSNSDENGGSCEGAFDVEKR